MCIGQSMKNFPLENNPPYSKYTHDNMYIHVGDSKFGSDNINGNSLQNH